MATLRPGPPSHEYSPGTTGKCGVTFLLGVPSPLFPGILLSKKPPKTLGKQHGFLDLCHESMQTASSPEAWEQSEILLAPRTKGKGLAHGGRFGSWLLLFEAIFRPPRCFCLLYFGAVDVSAANRSPFDHLVCQSRPTSQTPKR